MEAHHLKSDRELLELVGRFYKEKNLDLIRPYLHSNFIYASAWVTETLCGTQKFLKYIIPKFKTQEKTEWKMDYFLHPLSFNRTHFIILKQNNERDKTTIVCAEFKSGKIYYIKLLPTKQNGFSYRNIWPLDSFEKAKRNELSRKMHNYATRLDIKNVLQCLKKGAKINWRNNQGETVLTIFSKSEKISQAKFQISLSHLKQFGIGEELISKVNEMKKKIKDAGYFPEWGDAWNAGNYERDQPLRDQGYSMLDAYIRRVVKFTELERLAMMKKLIEKGSYLCDHHETPEYEFRKAHSALYYAVQNREIEIVSFLLNCFRHPNETIENALELAKCDLKVEQDAGEDFLLRNGKDIEMQRKEIIDLKIITQLLEKYIS